MTFKTILVQGGAEDSAVAGVKAALALGEPLGAAIVGVGAVSWDAYLAFVDPAFGFASGDTLQAMRDSIDDDLAAAEASFRALCAHYPHPTSWRSQSDDPARVMNSQARGADLIVCARPPKGFDRRRTAAPADLVMESGLPVLLLGTTEPAPTARNVLIGWKNTRESRRAVADALPLLKTAERVHVAQICETTEVEHVQAELADVTARLARHGVRAESITAPQLELSVADDLLDMAVRLSSDLIVLGAYGHSRLREWAFGGVTSDLMAASPANILFSR